MSDLKPGEANNGMSPSETMPFLTSAARVMQQCDDLAKISSMDNGICRTYLTPEHQRCNQQVSLWMQNAGMQKSWQDAAGNIWGQWQSGRADSPTLLLGSHLDSIPNAGKYDGILGVLIAIESIRQIHESATELPFNIEVVGFGDEEGSRFGTTLLGSRAVAGTWQQEWFDLHDRDGISLGNAMREFGLDPAQIESASRANNPPFCYLEVHIEQGPVLEQQNLALGVVSSIAGARRFLVKIRGKAGHAGTVPMDMRQDALVAAATAVHLTESIANRYQIVATVGQMQAYPGALNVIPGECQFSLDIRSGRDQTRDLAVEDIQAEVASMIEARKMTVEWQEIHSAPAVECASWIQRLWEDVLIETSATPISLVSGAGHDGMSIAPITDIGMLFVRCAGGVSHHPDEQVETADVEKAIDATIRMIHKLAERSPDLA